jgi:hypothetical protein
MTTLSEGRIREYRSGERVDPGLYLDVETGAVVRMWEREELPEEVRLVRLSRRFRRLESWPIPSERG